MFDLRLLVVGPAAALVIGAAGALASVGAITPANSDSHGDTVASSARTICPHGPGDAHGDCVSAVAKGTPKSPCKATDRSEDAAEKAADGTEYAADKATRAGKHAAKPKDKTQKALDRAEDQAEKASQKSCTANQ